MTQPVHALIDTHTHFDVTDFDVDRMSLALQARQNGIAALLLIGYEAAHFDRLVQTQTQLNLAAQQGLAPITLLAPGLHPAYIATHCPADIARLEQVLRTQHCIAIGEIGLDTYDAAWKVPSVYQQQKILFATQLDLAHAHQLPVLLHVRRAHADTLALLKQQRFSHGGIAHAFGGGFEEAKGYLSLGFKLGITGLITDPNAKRLRNTVQRVAQTFGHSAFVLETDCPDMTPLCCRHAGQHTRNTPQNLTAVFDGLAALLLIKTASEKQAFAQQLWHNTQHCLALDWTYAHARYDTPTQSGTI